MVCIESFEIIAGLLPWLLISKCWDGIIKPLKEVNFSILYIVVST